VLSSVLTVNTGVNTGLNPFHQVTQCIGHPLGLPLTKDSTVSAKTGRRKVQNGLPACPVGV